MTKNFIYYSAAGEAIEAYTALRYEYVEAPWIVSHEADRVTRPENVSPLFIDNQEGERQGNLVASAEQGIIHMMLTDGMKIGKFVSAGPCFRDEVVDEFHHKTFFKVELTQTFHTYPGRDHVDRSVKRMLDDAIQVHYKLTGRMQTPVILPTTEGYDLMLNDIEIGSYGYREYGSHYWIYGTGLALPRFHQALAAYKEL